MSAPKGNKNAVKGEKASSVLHVRCNPNQKAGWAAAAQREQKKLSKWVIGKLDAASE
jgi:hypothetical protein